MELRHLRYFVAVAEELNFTRAAAHLRVAQPALSSQIKDLEHELQAQLFERRSSGVQLTRAGKVLYQRARGILTEAARAVNEARTAAGAITGTIVVGYPSGLHLDYLRPAFEKFSREQPKVQFDFTHNLPANLIKSVREGVVDICFVNLPAPLDGLAHRTIWRVPFKVVLPRRHPLARRRSFTLSDLRGEDFVFCTRESRPEFYDDFFRHCANAGFRPNVVKEVGGYPTTMLGLISVGVGLSVLPHFERVERFSGIIWRPLTQPKLWTDWALLWRTTAPSRVVEEFVHTCEELFPAPAEPRSSGALELGDGTERTAEGLPAGAVRGGSGTGIRGKSRKSKLDWVL
jgi:DNA-binding transcriptional LysR family regulator